MCSDSRTRFAVAKPLPKQGTRSQRASKATHVPNRFQSEVTGPKAVPKRDQYAPSSRDGVRVRNCCLNGKVVGVRIENQNLVQQNSSFTDFSPSSILGSGALGVRARSCCFGEKVVGVRIETKKLLQKKPFFSDFSPDSILGFGALGVGLCFLRNVVQ